MSKKTEESGIDIKIGKYRMTADDRQFIVSQMKTHRSGKLKGTKTEVEQTFHGTLLGATQEIMKRKVLASKVTTMEEMINVVKTQNKLMQKWYDESLKAGVKIVKKEEKVSKKEVGISTGKVARKTVTKKK